MSEDLLNHSARSPRFSKRMVTKREFKFTSPTKKTPQKKRKAQNADPKVENSAQKSNENVFDLPPPIWASSPRDTPHNKFKSKTPKKLLEISCIEPVSVRTAKNLKRIEESHFAPITTPKQDVAKNNARKNEALLTKRKRNKTTSIGSIHRLQNSGKKVIQNKNKSLSSSKNRVAKSYQETNISNRSNKSLHKEKSKQLSKKEKSKVWDQIVTASKSQPTKSQPTKSQPTKSQPTKSPLEKSLSTKKTNSQLTKSQPTKSPLEKSLSTKKTKSQLMKRQPTKSPLEKSLSTKKTKSQLTKSQPTNSRNTRKSSLVHSEPLRSKSKSLIHTKSNTKLEVNLPVSNQDTNKNQTSLRDFLSKKGSIKRKLQKSGGSEDSLSNPSKSSKLQTNRKRSIEAAYLSQSSDDYFRNTNKAKSSNANSKRRKSDITSSHNNSIAKPKPKQQSGLRLGQRSRSLPKDDSPPPNITRTKQSPNQRSSSKKKTSSSRDSQKKVNVSKVQKVSKSNSSREKSKSSSRNIKDSKSSQLSKFSVSHVSRQSVSKNLVKNSLRKSFLREFNLSSEEEPEKAVKGKKVSNSQEKKSKRRSVESSASGKKKINTKNKISFDSLLKSNQSKDCSSSKLNAGKYANILSYLSTQNKQQISNRTNKTFESIATGITREIHEQMDQKETEKQFSFGISELSSVHISHITSVSENEDDPKLNDSKQKLNEANKCLEYIMFPGDSDNISLDNPKPIQLNVLENKNSMKRTVKSLSELDVILDVVDQSIEMVLRQVSDVDKKLVISRMRNFVKEKISTDIKRQLQLIQLQNILFQKSLKIKGQQQKYFELKVANNRLNNELNEAMKTNVDDPTEVFNRFCKKFSEFKKSSNQVE